MYVCMYVCMYACTHACTHACMHACMHVCIHTYMLNTWANAMWFRPIPSQGSIPLTLNSDNEESKFPILTLNLIFKCLSGLSPRICSMCVHLKNIYTYIYIYIYTR